MVKRSMSPVWEANHVWLIFVLVVSGPRFPMAFGSIFSTLVRPAVLAVVGIIFRGAAFALRGQAATIGEARVLGAMFALVLGAGAVLPGHRAGRRRLRAGAGRQRRRRRRRQLGSTRPSLIVGVLAVVTGAYLAAVFMAADSVRAGLARHGARRSGPRAGGRRLAGVVAVGALLVLRDDARPCTTA